LIIFTHTKKKGIILTNFRRKYWESHFKKQKADIIQFKLGKKIQLLVRLGITRFSAEANE